MQMVWSASTTALLHHQPIAIICRIRKALVALLFASSSALGRLRLEDFSRQRLTVAVCRRSMLSLLCGLGPGPDRCRFALIVYANKRAEMGVKCGRGSPVGRMIVNCWLT
jgi:hypothetical protein